MNTQMQTQIKAAPTPSFTPTRSGLLQRKCACGGVPGLTGECEECRKKRLTSQRCSDDQAEPSTVPPIVQEVLRSSGQPLDADTRAFMEPRFGHDFGQVRVHMDARAAESAREVNALAYTVGHNVVFGADEYAPKTHHGRGLLAHELAHTIQQRGASSSPPSMAPHGIFESSADAAGRAVASGGAVSRSFPACGVGLARAPVSPENMSGEAIAQALQRLSEKLKQATYPGDEDIARLLEFREDVARLPELKGAAARHAAAVAEAEAVIARMDEALKDDDDEDYVVPMDLSPATRPYARRKKAPPAPPSKFSPGGFTDEDIKEFQEARHDDLWRTMFEQAYAGDMLTFAEALNLAEALDSIQPVQEYGGIIVTEGQLDSYVMLLDRTELVLSQEEVDAWRNAFQGRILIPWKNRLEDSQRLTEKGETAMESYYGHRFDPNRGHGSFKDMLLSLQRARQNLEDKEAAEARWGGFGSSLRYHGKRFGKGVVEGAKTAVTEPFKQLHDLGLIALHETVGLDVDEDDLISNTAEAYRAGASRGRLLLSSIPVTAPAVTSYDMTTAILEGRSGDVSELGGGLAGGMLTGAAVAKLFPTAPAAKPVVPAPVEPVPPVASVRPVAPTPAPPAPPPAKQPQTAPPAQKQLQPGLLPPPPQKQFSSGPTPTTTTPQGTPPTTTAPSNRGRTRTVRPSGGQAKYRRPPSTKSKGTRGAGGRPASSGAKALRGGKQTTIPQKNRGGKTGSGPHAPAPAPPVVSKQTPAQTAPTVAPSRPATAAPAATSATKAKRTPQPPAKQKAPTQPKSPKPPKPPKTPKADATKTPQKPKRSTPKRTMAQKDPKYSDNLDERIARVRKEVGEANQRTVEYKAARVAAGENEKGGPSKVIWNKKEELHVLERARAYPDRTILEQVQFVGIKGADGKITPAADIAGKGRTVDFLEEHGGKWLGGEAKSKAEIVHSVEDLHGPNMVGDFKTKSKVGIQRGKEQTIIDEATTRGGKLVFKGKDVRTGKTVDREIDPKDYRSTVVDYDQIRPN